MEWQWRGLRPVDLSRCCRAGQDEEVEDDDGQARVARTVGALDSPRQEAGDASKSDGKKDCRTVLCMYIYMSGLRVRGVVGKPS